MPLMMCHHAHATNFLSKKTSSTHAVLMAYLLVMISSSESAPSASNTEPTAATSLQEGRVLDDSKAAKHEDNHSKSSTKSSKMVYAKSKFSKKSNKASKSKSGKRSDQNNHQVGWAPNESFYGKYITDFNSTFVAAIDSITISYGCIPEYKDLAPYVNIVLQQVTQDLPLNHLSQNQFSAITYLNATKNITYSRFDFIIDEESTLYYCAGDYYQSSIEQAITNSSATSNLTSGVSKSFCYWHIVLL